MADYEHICGHCSLQFNGKAYVEKNGSESDPMCYWSHHPNEVEPTLADHQRQLREAQEELAEGKRVMKTVPRRIHDLQEEQDEARRFLGEEQKALVEAERERDKAIERAEAAEKQVEAMQQEGCAAIGLVQNIFNGLTSPSAIGPGASLSIQQEMAAACAKLLTEATQCNHERDAAEQRALAFNFWKALRIWDIGEDWEKQGCRCCPAAWKPGEPAAHTEDCCFHPAPAGEPWR